MREPELRLDRFPIAPLPPLPIPAHKRPKLSPDLWPIVTVRAEYESLRDLAAEYNVSLEAVRTAIKRYRGEQSAAISTLAAD